MSRKIYVVFKVYVIFPMKLNTSSCHNILSVDRLPVLEAAAAEITAVSGNDVLPVQCDVRDADAVKAAVDACVERLGLPDVVVNNAAGNFISPTERLSANAFKTIVDIVLNGTAHLTLDVGKRMIQADKGMSCILSN